MDGKNNLFLVFDFLYIKNMVKIYSFGEISKYDMLFNLVI